MGGGFSHLPFAWAVPLLPHVLCLKLLQNCLVCIYVYLCVFKGTAY